MKENGTASSRGKSRTVIIIILSAAAAALLLCAVTNPLYTVFITDVAYSDTILPPIFFLLSKLLEAAFAALAASAALTVTAYSKTGGRKASLLFIPVAAVILFKHSLNLLVTLMLGGFDSYTSDDLIYTLLGAGTDIFIVFAAVAVAMPMTDALLCRNAALKKAYSTKGGKEYSLLDGLYPFDGFLALKNPVLAGAGVFSLGIFLSLAVSRIIYDISYGAPESAAGYIDIAAGYLTDILTGAAVYTAVYFILKAALPRVLPADELSLGDGSA